MNVESVNLDRDDEHYYRAHILPEVINLMTEKLIWEYGKIERTESTRIKLNNLILKIRLKYTSYPIDQLIDDEINRIFTVAKTDALLRTDGFSVFPQLCPYTSETLYYPVIFVHPRRGEKFSVHDYIR